MPRSSGLIRPSAVTAVASVNTSPAPPTARLPRCTMCQSVANPFGLEYSHIGDMTIRLRSVTSRSEKGENSSVGMRATTHHSCRTFPRVTWQPMLFATSTLAARIEKAEAAVAAEFAAAARNRGKDVLLQPIGGTTAVYGGPGEPFNKIAGLGFAAPLDEAAL